MNVLVVCQHYFPEQFRVTEICEQLVIDGYGVTVLTGLPNYPMGKIPKEYRWGRNHKESINGVNVIRCWLIGRKGGAVKLALNYFSFMCSSTIKAVFLKKNFDIIIVNQLSPITMAYPAVVLKKMTKKPLYLYCYDLWPESMKNIISRESSLIFRIMKRFSKFVYNQCDMISVTSQPFIKYLTDVHDVPSERINYLPQHADDTYLDMDLHAKNEITNFVFMGNIGIAQDVECIIDALAILKQDCSFKFHFVGDGSCFEKCKKMVEQYELIDYVVFHGRRPVEEMIQFYKMADACIITLKADNMIGYTMPGKLQGYMAAAKPVIGAIEGAARTVIEESGCGICVNAGDAQALAGAMKDYIEYPEKYSTCGEKGKVYFKNNFKKDIFMINFTSKLNGLADRSKNA